MRLGRLDRVGELEFIAVNGIGSTMSGRGPMTDWDVDSASESLCSDEFTSILSSVSPISLTMSEWGESGIRVFLLSNIRAKVRGGVTSVTSLVWLPDITVGLDLTGHNLGHNRLKL